jgi:hypothetical protein
VKVILPQYLRPGRLLVKVIYSSILGKERILVKVILPQYPEGI